MKLGKPINGELIRHTRFSPYRKGMGPWFTLDLYDLNETDAMGKSMLGYKLIIHDNKRAAVLFQGEDFACARCYAIDSDDTIKSLMGFLTLRPGDTDPDYFAHYTSAQTKFAAEHAEALSAEVTSRYGED